MSRSSSMAAIDAALAKSKAPADLEQVDDSAATTALADLALVEDEPKPEAKKLSKDQEAILKQQEALLGKEEADKLRAEQLQEANKAAAIKAGQKALKNAGNVVHDADVKIGAIATPGSILTPLVLLLLFFFVLVQIGGYTRIQWFWQVITGASRVGTTAATPAVTSVGGPGGTVTVGQGGEQPFSPGVESAWFASDGTTSFTNPNGVYGSPF